MSIDTNNKLDFLNQVSANNGIGFIDNYEAEFNNLNNNIDKEKEKASKLSELEKEVFSSNEMNKERVLSKIKDAFLCYNKNIEELVSLRKRFEDLYEHTINFITKNDTDYSESLINLELNEIQSNINSFSQDFSSIQDKIFLNDIKVESLVKEIRNKRIDIEEKIERNFENTVVNKEKQNNSKIYDMDDIEDNKVLIVSEKNKIVILPYEKREIISYYEKYPKDYRSYKDVIKKQFTIPISSYASLPSLARFREGYALARDNEAKSFFDALKFGLALMFKSNLYPAIIAACKTEDCLNRYIECLDKNKLDEFKDFEIRFEVTPLKI